MSIKDKKLPPSQKLASKVIYAAFEILRDNADGVPISELVNQIESKLTFDPWDIEKYEKTGNIRWKAMLHFFSIDCTKAGYLRKHKGVWHLTLEGLEAMKLTPDKMLLSAIAAYRVWKKQSKIENDEVVDDNEDDIASSDVTVDQAELSASEGIKASIQNKNAYEFQDLVAALLRGMGYYTPFVAPRGKDGGVDILAYRDPFGIDAPRIKVQVKHRQQTATVMEIRQLIGILGREGDVGLFVSTGGYTSDAIASAKNSHTHVQLINLNEFIDLWLEFYPKMDDDDKAHLPLKQIYFIVPKD